MKRDGYIIDEIIEWSNLEAAFDEVVRGTVRKTSAEGKVLLSTKKSFLEQVRAEIAAGCVTLGEWYSRDVLEHGKVRHIQIFCMKDRIKINAVMRVVDAHLRRRFIRTTSASIKGRGMHELMKYIRNDIKNDPVGMRYIYKFDIHHCYETVRHEFVAYCMHHTFKDRRLLAIVDSFIFLLEEGMSLGMRSSQGLVNLLLSIFLDHFLKDRYGVKHFYRYCDDGVAASDDKVKLWKIRGIIHVQIESIGQQIKPNERIFPLSDGLDFLGYVLTYDETRLRKRIKQDFARKLNRVKSRTRRRELTGSFYGMAKHADCLHLMKELFYPNEYKKYYKRIMKDFGVAKSNARRTSDGKKNFNGQKISGRELDRKPFIVVDFERDMIPKRERDEYRQRLAEASQKGVDASTVDPPKKKYLVSLIYNGQLRKLWTGDKRLWDELETRAEDEDGFPFFASMSVDYNGGTLPRCEFCSATALGFTMPTDEEVERLYKNLNIQKYDD